VTAAIPAEAVFVGGVAADVLAATVLVVAGVEELLEVVVIVEVVDVVTEAELESETEGLTDVELLTTSAMGNPLDAQSPIPTSLVFPFSAAVHVFLSEVMHLLTRFWVNLEHWHLISAREHPDCELASEMHLIEQAGNPSPESIASS